MQIPQNLSRDTQNPPGHIQDTLVRPSASIIALPPAYIALFRGSDSPPSITVTSDGGNSLVVIDSPAASQTVGTGSGQNTQGIVYGPVTNISGITPRAFAEIVKEYVAEQKDLAQQLSKLQAKLSLGKAEVNSLKAALERTETSAAAGNRKAQVVIDEALKRLNIILRFFPDDRNAINRLGHIYHLRGQLQKAQACYQRVLELSPGDATGQYAAYSNLGITYHTRGDLDQAEKMFRKALAIFEKIDHQEGMTSDYGNLGILCVQRNNMTGARANWTRARDLFDKIGMSHMVAKVQGWLDALPSDDATTP